MQHGADVFLDRRFAQTEMLGDGAVGGPGGDQLDDLLLTAGQRGALDVVGTGLPPGKRSRDTGAGGDAECVQHP